MGLRKLYTLGRIPKCVMPLQFVCVQGCILPIWEIVKLASFGMFKAHGILKVLVNKGLCRDSRYRPRSKALNLVNSMLQFGRAISS